MSYTNNQIAYSSSRRPMCGIGTEIEKGESREATINRAGLNFEIDSQPLTYKHDGETITDESKVIMKRSDNGFLIGINSKRFKKVNPIDMLTPFFDVVENLGFTPSLVGQFDGGRKLFLQGQAPNDLVINGDRISGVLTLSTANDGTAATTGDFMTNRIVCMNQCQMIMRKSGKLHSTRHTTSFDPAQLIRDLGLTEYNQAWATYEETMRELIDIRVTSKQAMETIHKLVGTGKPLTEEGTKTDNKIKQIYNNVVNSAGANHKNCQGTAYGVLQGIAYYTSHQASNNENNRAKGLLSNGAGTKLTNNALELLGMLEQETQASEQPNAIELLGM